MAPVADSDGVAKLAASSKVVVLDFGAGWCKNCAKMEPACEELASKLGGVSFASVDVDDAEELAEEYGVTSVPHFIVLVGGQRKGEYKGSSKDELEATIKKTAGL
jgi:thioredoxin 1